MTPAARVLAQAKINLLLHVLAQEKSGYHSIETLFQRIDLGDDVTVRATSGGRTLDCHGPALPAAGLGETARNLAFRAAELYQRETGWPAGFEIEIDKQIPVGGGLGGGSADAGAVLRCLDALAPRPLGARLVELAANIGADVPFLTAEDPLALAWSRGERMMSLPPLPPRAVALVIPDFSVATAEAYGWLAASRGAYVPRGRSLHQTDVASWGAVAGLADNDFEPVIAERRPVIGEIIGRLREGGATVAMMSGSGSSVFGVFPHAEDPTTVQLPPECAIIATRTSERVAQVVRLQ
ncbi:MAG TPA: 4-(cytidine 5'-diphospho)-2-C-methyl-D-erythritol kinase [Gemmatimonadaceae bacterium]